MSALWREKRRLRSESAGRDGDSLFRMLYLVSTPRGRARERHSGHCAGELAGSELQAGLCALQSSVLEGCRLACFVWAALLLVVCAVPGVLDGFAWLSALLGSQRSLLWAAAPCSECP